MNIDNKKLWLCACGNKDSNKNENRDYSSVCFEYGVVMIGPGHQGPYPSCLDRIRDDNIGEDGTSAKKFIKRIAEKMKRGHIVVLRRGIDTVLGVGEITSGYQYNCRFSTAEGGVFQSLKGWDISHCRQVRWLWKGEEEFKNSICAGVPNRLEELKSNEVIEWLKTLVIDDRVVNEPLPELPQRPCKKSICSWNCKKSHEAKFK